MFSGFRLWTPTIRTPTQAVKFAVLESGVKGLRIRRGKTEILVLLDFPMDKRLNDGTQKFLGNNINDLGTHLIENSLHNSLDKCWIRHRGLQWILGGRRVG